MTDLTFKVKNLGAIRQGEFTQKPLTVFCGSNNSGKTWVMYALYNSHNMLIDWREQTEKEKKPATLVRFNNAVSKSLADFFNTEPELFENTAFQLVTTKTGFQALLQSQTEKHIFLMPAERSGLQLFFRDVIQSRHALPIARYLDWLNQLPDIQRSTQKSSFHLLAQNLQKQIAQGVYKVAQRSGDINFKPYQKKPGGKSTKNISLHATSGMVKSLFGLWFFLQHQAQPGDVLMIDEPALNLHPENQSNIIRLLAQLVNAGLNIVISTHSYYIIRELNNLLIMNHGQCADLVKEAHDYKEDELLTADQVATYLFDENTIKTFNINPKDERYANELDEILEYQNEVYYEILYGPQG